MKLFLNTLFGLFGYHVSRSGTATDVHSTEPPNPQHLWETDPGFQTLYAEIKHRTLVDVMRCHILYQLSQQVATLPGLAAEIGVYQGGTARLLAKALARTGSSLHLFDTFAGMPETDAEKDWHKAGDFADTSLASVQAFLADCHDVQFHPGFFPQTVTPELAQSEFRFIHVDVDIFSSVTDCCVFFYPRMPAGGIMIFDDYGFLTCPGAKEAVDAFFADRPEQPCYLPTGQAVVIRLGDYSPAINGGASTGGWLKDP